MLDRACAALCGGATARGLDHALRHPSPKPRFLDLQLYGSTAAGGDRATRWLSDGARGWARLGHRRQQPTPARVDHRGGESSFSFSSRAYPVFQRRPRAALGSAHAPVLPTSGGMEGESILEKLANKAVDNVSFVWAAASEHFS